MSFVIALVFLISVPSGYSIYTIIWLGVLSGKNSTLVRWLAIEPKKLPKAINKSITVPIDI